MNQFVSTRKWSKCNQLTTAPNTFLHSLSLSLTGGDFTRDQVRRESTWKGSIISLSFYPHRMLTVKYMHHLTLSRSLAVCMRTLSAAFVLLNVSPKTSRRVSWVTLHVHWYSRVAVITEGGREWVREASNCITVWVCCVGGKATVREREREKRKREEGRGQLVGHDALDDPLMILVWTL